MLASLIGSSFYDPARTLLTGRIARIAMSPVSNTSTPGLALGLVSEETAHARLLISAKRNDPRLAFTTLLLEELLSGASRC